MVLAAQCEGKAQTPRLHQVSTDLLPEAAGLTQQAHVSSYVEAVLGAGQSYTHTVVSSQESSVPFGIASYQRKKDDLVFLTLEVVNHSNSHSSAFWVLSLKLKGRQN